MLKYPTCGISHKKEQKIPIQNNNQSLWDLFKQYINNLYDGQKFTRGELIDYIYADRIEYVVHNTTAVDFYRYNCERICILRNLDNDCYVKDFSIPGNLNLLILRKHSARYKKDTWNDWFVPCDKRIEAIYAECNNMA